MDTIKGILGVVWLLILGIYEWIRTGQNPFKGFE